MERQLHRTSLSPTKPVVAKVVVYPKRPELIDGFMLMKTALEAALPAGEKAEVELVFHGTASQNIPSIMKDGMDMLHLGSVPC